jgi:hypothetical protein
MTVQLTTTLNRIRAHKPSHAEWTRLLAGLGKTRADNRPLPFATILRINGLDFALWCARAEPQHEREWRLFLVWCVRQVQHLLTDPRSLAALDVAERHANGMATDEELRAAWAAAEDAAGDALAVARAAAWAALAAALAAAGTGAGAAWDVAWVAARAALAAAGNALAVARAVARAAAGDGKRQAQAAEFLRLVGGE